MDSHSVMCLSIPVEMLGCGARIGAVVFSRLHESFPFQVCRPLHFYSQHGLVCVCGRVICVCLRTCVSIGMCAVVCALLCALVCALLCAVVCALLCPLVYALVFAPLFALVCVRACFPEWY